MLTKEYEDLIREARANSPDSDPWEALVVTDLLKEIDRLRDVINHNLEQQLYCERTQGKQIKDFIEENKCLMERIVS